MRELLSGRNLRGGRVRAVLQQFAPAERPSNCLDHCIIDVPVYRRGGEVGTVGREDELPSTAFSNRDGHSHGDDATVAVIFGFAITLPLALA